MDIWQLTGVAGLLVSNVGLVLTMLRFELDPQRTYGFGAIEIMIMPWLIGFCTSLGLAIGSIRWPLLVYLLGVACAEPGVKFVASLLASKHR